MNCVVIVEDCVGHGKASARKQNQDQFKSETEQSSTDAYQSEPAVRPNTI
jgi:hypothetical protein